jgi:hypothetical protein
MYLGIKRDSTLNDSANGARFLSALENTLLLGVATSRSYLRMVETFLGG